ncbi:MAG TPA: phosphatase PAP2 family protein [Candidatus Saccharimonadales bacterium]|nr:phosphatase PAP2 family protein [Candidatus Saccharimonadales bacterium]
METVNKQNLADNRDHQDDDYPRSYIFGLIVGIILFLPALYIASKHNLSGLQLSIFRDLNNLSDTFKYPALILTEGLGAAYPIIICVLVPLLIKRYRLAWRFFATAGGAGVVMEIAKKIAKEPRPAALLHGNLHVRAVETGLNSFPSGHETIATALALTLWIILPRKWRWLSILWIIIVGLSRIYVGDHTPDDIIGGFAVGLISVCVVRLLPPKIARVFRLDDDKSSLLDKGF